MAEHNADSSGLTQKPNAAARLTDLRCQLINGRLPSLFTMRFLSTFSTLTTPYTDKHLEHTNNSAEHTFESLRLESCQLYTDRARLQAIRPYHLVFNRVTSTKTLSHVHVNAQSLSLL